MTLTGTACFRERNEALNPGRATESYKLCSQEQPAPTSPHTFPLCDMVSNEKEGISRPRISPGGSWWHLHPVLQKPEELHQHLDVPLHSPSRSSSMSFCWPLPSCRSQAAPQKRLTNDSRFQCIISLSDCASALFFIHLLLLSAYVQLRTAGAGNGTH